MVRACLPKCEAFYRVWYDRFDHAIMRAGRKLVDALHGL